MGQSILLGRLSHRSNPVAHVRPNGLRIPVRTTGRLAVLSGQAAGEPYGTVPESGLLLPHHGALDSCGGRPWQPDDTGATFFSVHLPTPPSSVEERRDWRYSVTDCELQSNDSDCGSHSILNFLRAVAFHRDGRWYPGPGAIRRRVAAMLLSPVGGSSWCADLMHENVES